MYVVQEALKYTTYIKIVTLLCVCYYQVYNVTGQRIWKGSELYREPT